MLQLAPFGRSAAIIFMVLKFTMRCLVRTGDFVWRGVVNDANCEVSHLVFIIFSFISFPAFHLRHCFVSNTPPG